MYRYQWQSLLKIDQGIDKGPKEMETEEFDKNCLRCGRTLNTPGRVISICSTHKLLDTFETPVLISRPTAHVEVDWVQHGP